MRTRVLSRVAMAWVGIVLPAPVLASSDIRLAADVWCPYNCGPLSDHPGFVVEIAREIFARADRPVDYQVMAWSRSIAEARAGREDGIICAIPADAPDFIYPREPVASSSLGVVVVTTSAFRFDGPSSLRGKVVGAVAGYAFSGDTGAYIAAHGHDPGQVQLVAGNDALAQNLHKLVAGRVDVVIDDANVLTRAINQLGLSGRLKLAGVTEALPLYIAFSPAARDGPLLAQTLSDGIVRLRASGRLAAILARYDLTDWK